jgi:hypothetical protein
MSSSIFACRCTGRCQIIDVSESRDCEFDVDIQTVVLVGEIEFATVGVITIGNINERPAHVV